MSTCKKRARPYFLLAARLSSDGLKGVPSVCRAVRRVPDVWWVLSARGALSARDASDGSHAATKHGIFKGGTGNWKLERSNDAKVHVRGG